MCAMLVVIERPTGILLDANFFEMLRCRQNRLRSLEKSFYVIILMVYSIRISHSDSLWEACHIELSFRAGLFWQQTTWQIRTVPAALTFFLPQFSVAFFGCVQKYYRRHVDQTVTLLYRLMGMSICIGLLTEDFICIRDKFEHSLGTNKERLTWSNSN